MPAPLVVLVSGPPATGKSPLARRLAEALSLPVLSRDTLKEVLADTLGAPTYADGEGLGRAANALFHALLLELGRGGAGVVAEGWLQRGRSEPVLRPLLAVSRVVQIHCTAPPEEVLRRYAARFACGERHPCHFDGEKIARVRSGAVPIDWRRFDSLELDIPTLRVDTTAGYTPDEAAIVAFVRAAPA